MAFFPYRYLNFKFFMSFIFYNNYKITIITKTYNNHRQISLSCEATRFNIEIYYFKYNIITTFIWNVFHGDLYQISSLYTLTIKGTEKT